MKPEKNESRLLRSKTAIREALMALLEEKPIDRISIKELSETAGINRKTFYAHYERVEDVAFEIESEIVANMEAFMQATMIDEYGLGPQYFLHFVNVLYSNNPVFFENMFRLKNYHFLVEHLKKSLKQQILAGLSVTDENRLYLSYEIEFCLGGVSAMVVEWIRKGKEIPFEELLQLLAQFLSDHIN